MTTTQELILGLLKWTWDEYCHYQYVTGLQQIGKLLPRLTSLSTVEESPEFWESFRRRWNRCDELFIDDLPMDIVGDLLMEDRQSKEVLDMYKNYHGFEAFEALPLAVQRKINEQKYQELRKS